MLCWDELLLFELEDGVPGSAESTEENPAFSFESVLEFNLS